MGVLVNDEQYMSNSPWILLQDINQALQVLSLLVQPLTRSCYNQLLYTKKKENHSNIFYTKDQQYIVIKSVETYIKLPGGVVEIWHSYTPESCFCAYKIWPIIKLRDFKIHWKTSIILPLTRSDQSLVCGLCTAWNLWSADHVVFPDVSNLKSLCRNQLTYKKN